MTNAARAQPQSSAVRAYQFFSFAALLGMVVLLAMKGMDLWCVLPLVLGSLSLLSNWKSGPVFVLISLAIMMSAQRRGFDPITCLHLSTHIVQFGGIPVLSVPGFTRATPLVDVLLAICVLAYLAGHYRLQALVHYIVPPELRGQPAPAVARREAAAELSVAELARVPVLTGVGTLASSATGNGKATLPLVNPRRGTATLIRHELPLLALTAAMCALAAEYASGYFGSLEAPPGVDFSGIGWRALMFIWWSALAIIVGWAAFGYIRWSRATVAESMIYLQDQLWRQTRREQGRINRWLVWARLRGARRKEKSS